MEKKRDRVWAQREEAIAILAEHPNMTAAEAFGALFNSTPDTLRTAANGLKAGIVARKRAEAERLAKELAEHDKANAATEVAKAAEAKAAEVDARLTRKSA